MSPNIKTALLAAAAAAAFVAASFVAVQPSRAEVFVGDRYAYRIDTRYDAEGNRRGPADFRPDRIFPRADRIHAVARASGPAPFPVKQARARRYAIVAWEAKAFDRYGGSFANWRSARDPLVNCDAGFGSVSCEVSAVPSRGWRRWGQVRD